MRDQHPVARLKQFPVCDGIIQLEVGRAHAQFSGQRLGAAVGLGHQVGLEAGQPAHVRESDRDDQQGVLPQRRLQLVVDHHDGFHAGVVCGRVLVHVLPDAHLVDHELEFGADRHLQAALRERLRRAGCDRMGHGQAGRMGQGRGARGGEGARGRKGHGDGAQRGRDAWRVGEGGNQRSGTGRAGAGGLRGTGRGREGGRGNREDQARGPQRPGQPRQGRPDHQHEHPGHERAAPRGLPPLPARAQVARQAGLLVEEDRALGMVLPQAELRLVPQAGGRARAAAMAAVPGGGEGQRGIRIVRQPQIGAGPLGVRSVTHRFPIPSKQALSKKFQLSIINLPSHTWGGMASRQKIEIRNAHPRHSTDRMPPPCHPP